MLFTGHYFFTSFRDMISKIIKYYNDNKGSNQPTINDPAYDTDNFPEHTYGEFDFGDGTTCYDALMEVLNRLILPRAGGGDAQYYVLNFEGETRTHVVTRIVPVGSRPTNVLTLEKPLALTEVKSPMKGNVVIVKGKHGSGSYPKETALFRSYIEEFENIPKWVNDIAYKKDSYVTHYRAGVDSAWIPQVFKAKKDSAVNVPPHTTTTNATATWEAISLEKYIIDQYGSDIDYSPLTKQKATSITKNAGSNAGNNSNNSFFVNAVPTSKNGFDALAFADSNLVIRDATAWRTWVDFRVNRIASIPGRYLYPATTDNPNKADRIYRGMRVLVDSSLPTAEDDTFSGTDRFNQDYTNAIVQYDGNEWIVMKNAEQFDQVAVLHTGHVYEYNSPLGDFGATVTIRSKVRNSFKVGTHSISNSDLAWRDMSATPMGNDCFHYPIKCQNTTGLIGEAENSVVSLTKADGTKYTDNSAIEIEYSFAETNVLEDLIDKIFDVNLRMVFTDFVRTLGKDANNGLDYSELTNDEFNKLYEVGIYNDGWWAPLFKVPLPFSKYNGITENVGQIYGGTADNKRPTLDVYNLNETPKGNTSYVASDASELGTLTGIKLLMNMDIQGLDVDVLRGDIPIRCVIYDIEDNVWISDAEIRFQEESYDIEFPFSSFRIYRARRGNGWGIADQVSKILNPELKIVEVFEPRLIKMISVHTLLTHDDQGRYDPFAWEYFLRKIFTIGSGLSVKFNGKFDAFHFTKTPYAIAKKDYDEMHITAPIKNYPNISNMAQLQKIADAELDRATFQQDLFEIEYEKMVRVEPGDKVYVKDTDFIPSSEDDSGSANTRELIVEKVTYTVNSEGALSGLVTVIKLYKKVEA